MKFAFLFSCIAAIVCYCVIGLTGFGKAEKNALRASLAFIIVPSAVLSLYFFWLRPWQLSWGATEEELNRPMPGDEIVKEPAFDATRGLTVKAPPEYIWPWIVQIGFKRAGFYSYDWIDHRGIPSAERILPELQTLQVGDEVPLSESGYVVVRTMEPNRSMMWESPDYEFTWAWGLYELDSEHTRLVTRLRARFYPTSFGAAVFIVVFDIGDFIMMRKCMLGIKRGAETGTTASFGATLPISSRGTRMRLAP
ncbi:MAG: hypothetical protein JSW52_01345 [Candidatus Coatesbacteria bacterium]|nr:MAG: hypothetical protein JSW52_01345 [Candidatus Coatesbacteria bacterium]